MKLPWISSVLVALWCLSFVWQTQLQNRELVRLHEGLGLRADQLAKAWSEGVMGTALLSAKGLGLATYALLHSDLLHLLCNLLVFWVVGRRIERGMGSRRFLGFCVITVLGGAIVEIAWFAEHGGAPLVGASALVAACLGGYLSKRPKGRARLFFPLLWPPVVELGVIYLAVAWCLLQWRPVLRLMALGPGAPQAWPALIACAALGSLVSLLLWRSRTGRVRKT